MTTVYERIVELLDNAGVVYEVAEHDPVVTSHQAEAVTGFPKAMGAKSILFKADGGFVLVVIRGSHRADFKKLRKLFVSRKARLATPDEVHEVMGVTIGACYPFGDLAKVEMVVDSGLANNHEISFSPGVHDKHIKLKWVDYHELVRPKLVDIVSEK